MSEQGGLLTNHRVHEVLAELERRVHALDLTHVPEAHGDVERLREVLAHVRVRVEAAQAPLVSASMLERVAVALEAVGGSIGQFEAEENAAYLEAASAACDDVLGAVAALPAPAPSEEVEAVREGARAFRDQAAEMVESLRSRAAEVTSQIGELSGKLDDNRSAAAAEVQAVTDELAAMKLNITEQITALEAARTTFESSSAAELQTAKKNFSDAAEAAVTKVKEDGSAALKAFEEERKTSAEQYKTTAGEIIERLEQLRDEAVKLVGTVTGTATAGYFKAVADKEREAADKWRWVSVVSVVAIAVIGFVILWTAGDDSFEWTRFSAKVFVTLPLVALAGYAGAQSSEHRAAERRARHSELQLAALEPYAAALDDETALRARSQLAEHLFGPPPAVEPAGSDEVVTASSLLKVLERVVVKR